MRRQVYRREARDATPALLAFTRAKRGLEHDELMRELLVELQRLRAEVQALRLTLARRRAA
jgi:hypothetical protein